MPELRQSETVEAKPFRGKLRDWYRFEPNFDYWPELEGIGLGYLIKGRFDGHEDFNGYDGGTSIVLRETPTPNEDVIEIETLNSIYLLVGAPRYAEKVYYGQPVGWRPEDA